MKQYQKFARYLRGTAAALKVLADEIEQDGAFTKESKDLVVKVSSEMLFHAVSYAYLSTEVELKKQHD